MIELHHAAERRKVLARSYDYVIVGAGSAGCMVARRLLDDTDATVLAIEAGGSGEGVASLSNPPQWLENIGSQYDAPNMGRCVPRVGTHFVLVSWISQFSWPENRRCR